MSVSFLSKFIGNLSAIQTRQIFRILAQMRDRGEIRTDQEFQDTLKQLAKLIQKSELESHAPEFTFVDGDTMESFAVANWMDSIRLDNESALGETEHLSNVLRAYERLLNENYLDAVESAINELESKIRAYEVLDQRRYDGFSSVIQSFAFDRAIASPGAYIHDPSASTLFVDARSGSRSTPHWSAPRPGERGLHLAVGREGEILHSFRSVEVLNDSTTPSTALNVATDTNIPEKAIDGDKNTAWKHSILLKTTPSQVRLRFAANFSSAKRVNAIAFEPLVDAPVQVVSITYTDLGGTRQTAAEVGSSVATGTTRRSLMGSRTGLVEDWIFSSGPVVIPIGDITAKRIEVVLQQDSATSGRFHYSGDAGGWVKDGDLTDYAESDAAGAEYEEARDVARFMGYSTPTRTSGSFFEYTFGFKEFYAIERSYEDNGLFICEPIEVSGGLSTLAIHTDVEFPTGEDTDVELLLRKENYDKDGELIDAEMISVPHYGDSSAEERLFLVGREDATATEDVGRLRFYPDFSASFTVYKDGTELAINSDYEVSVDGGSTWETSLPPTGTPSVPRTCLMKIRSPRSESIYVVSYTPLTSGTTAGSEVFLSASRTAWLEGDQTISFRNTRESGAIARSKLILQVITRANTLNTRVSPYTREIVMLGG